MALRPRAVCPECGELRASRWVGETLLLGRHIRSGDVCAGSGRTVKPQEPPPEPDA